MPVGDIYQATFVYDIYGQVLMNVLQYRTLTVTGIELSPVVTTGVIATKLKDIVTVGAAAHDIKQIISSSVSMRYVQVQRIAPIRYAFQRADIETPGLRAPTEYTNVNTVVTKQRELSRKGGQPAIHLPPAGQGDYQDGILDLDFKILVQENTEWLWKVLVVDGANIELAPIVWRGTDAIPQYDNIFDNVVQKECRVMTRRTVGRGI